MEVKIEKYDNNVIFENSLDDLQEKVLKLKPNDYFKNEKINHFYLRKKCFFF